jgi:hypothetical protein
LPTVGAGDRHQSCIGAATRWTYRARYRSTASVPWTLGLQ